MALLSRRATRRLLIALAEPALLTALYLGARLKLAYDYPYGFTHCCDKQLWMVLREYADAHGGEFPQGGATPDASLSRVVAGEGDINVDLLRGERLSAAVVREQMRTAGELTPATCGWNYVEGLTTDDNECALFWDKDGLGHNGQRLEGGGYVVTFVSANSEHIPAARWNAFLAEQAKLRAAALARRQTKTTAPRNDEPASAP